MSTIQEILSEFGRKTGLGNLRLNEDGLCRLVFDGTLTVDVEKTSAGFVLHSVVGQIPGTNKSEFYEMLLDANGPEQVVGQTALGIDSNLNEVLLFQNFTDMTPTYAYFEKALDTFLGEIGKWKARLSGDWENFDDSTLPPKKESGDYKPAESPIKPQSSGDFDPSKLPPGMIKA